MDSVEPSERCGRHGERFERGGARAGVSSGRWCWRGRGGGVGSDGKGEDRVKAVAATAGVRGLK